MSGSARLLSGERDQNFHLRTPAGRDFVLKMAHPLEHPEVTDFQAQALLHIATCDSDLPVPRVCRALNGATETTVDVGLHRRSAVRLLTYLQGTPLGGAASTPELRAQLGVCLALLGRALRDFAHPGSERGLLWDVSRAAALAGLLQQINVDVRKRSRHGKALGPAPATAAASAAVNGLRDRGVLIGVTGPHTNVLKMRPPMVFSRENADQLLEALEATLRAI